MCCWQAAMSPWYVLSTSTDVSLLCAVSKHQCLLAVCCWQAPMSPCYVLSASTNVSLQCAVAKHQHLPADLLLYTSVSVFTSNHIFFMPYIYYFIYKYTSFRSLLCAVGKHQCLLGMCCRQAPMSPWYVLSTSTNVFLLCGVGKHQYFLAMCCSQLRKSTCFLWL